MSDNEKEPPTHNNKKKATHNNKYKPKSKKPFKLAVKAKPGRGRLEPGDLIIAL